MEVLMAQIVAADDDQPVQGSLLYQIIVLMLSRESSLGPLLIGPGPAW